MKAKFYLFVLSLITAVTGCTHSSIQTMADFRGQRIIAGQSVDSVESHLGQPDWALNSQIN